MNQKVGVFQPQLRNETVLLETSLENHTNSKGIQGLVFLLKLCVLKEMLGRGGGLRGCLVTPTQKKKEEEKVTHLLLVHEKMKRAVRNQTKGSSYCARSAIEAVVFSRVLFRPARYCSMRSGLIEASQLR